MTDGTAPPGPPLERHQITRDPDQRRQSALWILMMLRRIGLEELKVDAERRPSRACAG